MRRDSILPVVFIIIASTIACAQAQPADIGDAKSSREKRVAELRRLVDEVAKGDDDDATDAADRLVDAAVGPLAEAIGGLDRRSVVEQVRLRRVLARVNAALRVRLFRADLPPADAKLFDAFAAKYADLVIRLFDDDSRRRHAAIAQIPLEPGTGAGVLIVGKINDWDDDVADAALRAAAALHDDIVARGLTHYIIDGTAAIRSNFYGPKDQNLAQAVVVIVSKAIQVLPKTGTHTDLKAVADAAEYLGHSANAEVFDVPAVLAALGELQDEAVANVLMGFLDNDRLAQTRSLGPGKLVRQTVGDRALLSLLRVYKLSAADLAVIIPPEHEEQAGFMDIALRDAAHRSFRVWYQQNADKPAAQRSALTPVNARDLGAAPTSAPSVAP
jgi:hypothetical protein